MSCFEELLGSSGLVPSFSSFPGDSDENHEKPWPQHSRVNRGAQSILYSPGGHGKINFASHS